MGTQQPALPIPDIAAFCTQSAAAQRIGVHHTTVFRWIKRGKLKTYSPRCLPGENAPQLLSCAEVDAFRAARRIVNGGG